MTLSSISTPGVLVLAATLAAAPARADVILDWNAHAMQAIAVTGGQTPPRALVRLAMVQLAVYDAVNAVEGGRGRGYASVPAVDRPASPEAAAATAAHDVLVALFPAQKNDLDAKYAASLAQLPGGPAMINGIAAGQRAAAGILEARVNDNRDAAATYTPGAGPGAWVPTPPGLLPAQAPETPLVRPFVLASASQLRPGPPPDFASRRWARDYNEVLALGPLAGSSRTDEQTEIARFWTDSPTLQWARAWRTLAAARGLTLPDNARYFAMLSTAGADAVIACWDAKFHYSFWRPVTAIRAGDTDGNARTDPDPAWIGIAATPNHPEYPAGHGCLSGAVTATLEEFFDTDRMTFTIDSAVTGLASPVRTYHSFSDALREVLDARVYGGMHFRNSTRVGAVIGRKVARRTARLFERGGGRP